MTSLPFSLFMCFQGRLSEEECTAFAKLVRRPLPAALSSQLSRVKPLNLAATSHLLPRRTILALHKDRTNSVNGIFRIEQLRPVDMLFNLIKQYRQANAPEVHVNEQIYTNRLEFQM